MTLAEQQTIVDDAPRAKLPRVLIVTENASYAFGGEAVLPLHYFRRLYARDVAVWLITNQRNRAELAQVLSAEELSRVSFAPDTWVHRVLERGRKFLPPRLATFLVGWVMHVLGQLAARRIARGLIAQHGIDVVHQPIPVSPRQVSLLHGLGVPVILGPMNGGMSFPPAFRGRERRVERWFNRLGRGCSDLFHVVMPGKRRAELLLVANERTRAALPRGIRGRVELVSENGVDAQRWAPQVRAEESDTCRLIYVGRLVALKAVDLLLRALAQVREPVALEIVGDGEERAALEKLVAELRLEARVKFAGWLAAEQCAARVVQADVFVLPSLHECGGAAVLEAMAAGLPCIAADWGGPADYLDASCGLLVAPSSAEDYVQGLAAAIGQLARSRELRHRLGIAGRAKVRAQFDWERKIDAMLTLYALARRGVGS